MDAKRTQVHKQWRGAAVILLMWVVLALVTGAAFFYFAAFAWCFLVVAAVLIHLVNVQQLYAQFEVDKTDIAAGESVAINYRVMNQSLVPAFNVLIQPVLSKSFGFDAFDSDAHTLDSYEYKVIERGLICHRRGFYTLGQVKFEVTDPLGLVTTCFSKSRPIELVVRPRIYSIDETALRPMARQGQKGMSIRREADRSAIKSVRPFVEGDSLRDVHWKLSAQTGHLMTKQFTQSVQASLFLIIDGYSQVYDPEGLEADQAMDLAASLIKFWLDRQQQVQLIFTDQAKTRVSLRNLGDFPRVLDLLTAFCPDGSLPLDHFMARFMMDQRQEGHVVTLSPDPSDKLKWMMRSHANSRQLVWQHYVISQTGGERL